MSNPIRYCPLLARALAGELRAALTGRLAVPQPVFAGDLSCTLHLDRGESLRWDLHPRRGWIRLETRAKEDDPGDPTARIVRVTAPADERLLRIDLHEGGRFKGGRRALVIELHTNQWNALLIGAEDRRIVSALRSRDAGGRSLRPGAAYHPPEPARRLLPDAPRDTLWAAWVDALRSIPPADRPRALVRRFSYTSPLNAASLLGTTATSDDADALAEAFERWWEAADGDSTAAFLVLTPKGPQPYPMALDGLASSPAPSLLAAMAQAAESADVEPDVPAAPSTAGLLDGARKRLLGAERRIRSLVDERAATGDADRLRGLADLLLAHLDWPEPGAAEVILPGFEGDEVTVPLDPKLRPHENAEALYEEARRLDRAAARIPELLEAAEKDRERWAGAVEALEAGETPPWIEGALRRAGSKERAAAQQPGERLPYRPYRTSGGLEVRVGRTSKDNDRLTFHHAAPGDVWLHARSVPGSHVVLRWSGEGAPPARDLEEAAVLAAWHSKARSSGTVAVDWTRRRYVRKPRNAPPGRVSLIQAKTVFVAPDPELEERLRVV